LEYFNNIFCISKPDLTDGNPRSDSVKERPVMSVDAYDSYVRRFPHVRVRNGGGPGRPALLNYDQLRSDIKLRVMEKYGDVKLYMRRNLLHDLVEPDLLAASFFGSFLFDDDTNIKPERQAEYNANATVLNAVGKYVMQRSGKSKSISKRTSGIWEMTSDAVNTLDRTRYPHSLPSNPLRLKEKYQNYHQHGYQHLIHKGNKNANAKKVNDTVERLIISLYCQQNLPFGSWVYDDYLQFLSGQLQIVDKSTGLLYDREDFFDQKRGTYITISRSTVWNIVNNPANAMIIHKFRNNRIDHYTCMTPMNHRKSPLYSLSKITMDDRDLPRKTSDGKWVHTYMAFDVASQSVLSCVYSLQKPDHEMVWNCFREMYRNINEQRLMWPGEVEVENHLMKELTAELNNMFSYVTFCQPGLPQSKRAEHFLHFKKYHVEKRKQKGIGRFFQKGAYKTLKAGKGEEYEQEHLPLDVLIAEDQEINMEYNHSLHPNQKLYPGKTRWQVLLENMNPDLGRPQKHKLFRYMGIKTETSIRNNDFAKVMYKRYLIDNLSAIQRLKPGNYSVEAYYVPERDGSISEVYMYQGDTFITRGTMAEQYNEAKMERTAEDERIRIEQSKRKAHYFKNEREGIEEKITRKLDISKPDPELIGNLTPEVIIVPDPEPEDFESQLEEDTRYYMSEEYKSRSLKTF
jgi:hypothetical protein